MIKTYIQQYIACGLRVDGLLSFYRNNYAVWYLFGT